MKGEKSKIVLIYILMLLVIALVVALTFVILNNNSKQESKESSATTTPTVDVNPYPNISDICTFNLSLSDYNALTGPGCKGGYSRYNVTDITLEGQPINVVVIYSDQNGNKAGLYINDHRFGTKVDNVTNFKLGIFDNKLFILDTNNNESNVLVFKSDSTKVYDLKEALSSAKISDPAFQTLADPVISSKTIDSSGFSFGANSFTFKTQANNAGQVINGSTYQVNFNGDEFSKPTFINMN